MGAAGSDIDEEKFKSEWRATTTENHLTLWEKKDQPGYQVEQYHVHSLDDEKTHQLYKLRKNSPYLVNAYTLASDATACASDQTKKVFVQPVPLRLSNVQDVPFPDVIHLLDVCINGFSQLSEVMGYFPVDEQMIGINEAGQVRVWLSSAFQSSNIMGNRKVAEPEMLQDILTIVFNTIDHDSFPRETPDILEYIGFPDNHTTFDDVREKFNTYVRLYNRGFVQLQFQCLQWAGGAERINDWCRRNSSYGFQQNSMRLSEKALRQSARGNPNVAPAKENLPVLEQTVIIPQPTQPFGTPDLPLYYNVSQTINPPPQPQPLPQHFQQAIINPAVQQQVIRQFVPQNIITPQPINAVPPPAPSSNKSSAIQLLKQASRTFINVDPLPQAESRLQQQRVISQTIEIKEHSKASELLKSDSNNPSYRQTQTQISRTSQSNLPLATQEPIQTSNYRPETISPQQKQSASSAADDGRSSSDFLALLSKLKGDSNQVYSQVSATPASAIKQDSSPPSRKYFNHQNFQETYSQQAQSNYGQDSHKIIDTGFNYNPAAQSENDYSKYAGEYNFTKYEREIDPELQADLARYK